MPRLTLFLGGGGVGKTTLSAALGVARARAGERVGLLSIDPARRLRSALHLETIDEAGVVLPFGRGELRAAVLEPEVCLRRWASEACPDDTALLANPFFVALAGRLAGATDALAAARAAEWAERDPSLDELIIDTAPGVPGIELLARPEKLLELLSGRLVSWLRHAGHGGRILGGLTRIAGVEALERAAEFFRLVDQVLQQLIRWLQRARVWLREANVIVVAGVSGASSCTAKDIAAAGRQLDLSPRLAVLNRALPPSLRAVASEDPTARQFFRYVDHYRGLQSRVAAELSREFPRVITLPESGRVDLEGLTELGRALIAGGLTTLAD